MGHQFVAPTKTSQMIGTTENGVLNADSSSPLFPSPTPENTNFHNLCANAGSTPRPRFHEMIRNDLLQDINRCITNDTAAIPLKQTEECNANSGLKVAVSHC